METKKKKKRCTFAAFNLDKHYSVMNAHLFEQIKNGEITAFNLLYKEYYRKLCYIALHILHDKSCAEEVADDVLFYLWDHREEIKNVSIEGYLVQAVRHGCINRVQSAYHQKQKLSDSITDAPPFFLSLFADDDPLKDLISQELEQAVDKAMHELPEQTRKVFLMSRTEKKKYQEIAAELGITVPTVKYHMKNAQDKLREALKRSLILLLLLNGLP